MAQNEPRSPRRDSRLRAFLNKESNRFALTFGLLCAVFFGVYFFPYAEVGASEAWFTIYLAKYASLVGHVLSLVEPNVSVSGNVVSGRFSISIVKSCDAMDANILFAAAVLAFPGPWRRKAIALVCGLCALLACNVLRICSLYYIGIYFPRAFEFAHFDVWPLVVIAFALVDFLVCVRWTNRDGLRPKGDDPRPSHAMV